jgi:hypothetical protein
MASRLCELRLSGTALRFDEMTRHGEARDA